jgi:hypothetical protein
MSQLTDELAATQVSIGALDLARQEAVRKAAIDGTAVKINRSELSAAQDRRDEIQEMMETIRIEIERLEKDLPRLANNIGTARRAFAAAICAAKLDRLFGQVRREDVVDCYVLNMSAMAGARCKTIAELIDIARPPIHDELQASALRVKAECGFAPY